ncbi:MAG: hypothetical protein R3346_04580 [Candidatus Spechtbacterales bacterium]|nr:hypothetical protein [Candidatus Spechtbacterales bacterium]
MKVKLNSLKKGESLKFQFSDMGWIWKAVKVSTSLFFVAAILFGSPSLLIFPVLFVIYDLFGAYLISGENVNNFWKHTIYYYLFLLGLFLLVFLYKVVVEGSTNFSFEFSGSIPIFVMSYIFSSLLYFPLKSLSPNTKVTIRDSFEYSIISMFVNLLVFMSSVFVLMLIIGTIFLRQSILN